jgi:hypothetical protein
VTRALEIMGFSGNGAARRLQPWIGGDLAMMQKQSTILLFFMFATFALAGCEAVKGIFKAGVWVGGLIALLAVVMIAFATRLARH